MAYVELLLLLQLLQYNIIVMLYNKDQTDIKQRNRQIQAASQICRASCLPVLKGVA